mgnify:CR=1 FL=1
MEKQEIKLTFEVHCEGSQGDSYRLYLGKDLLTERTWRWSPNQTYLREVAPLKLPRGEYDLRVERVEPATAVFTLNNLTAEGARIDNHRIIVE